MFERLLKIIASLLLDEAVEVSRQHASWLNEWSIVFGKLSVASEASCSFASISSGNGVTFGVFPIVQPAFCTVLSTVELYATTS